MVRCRLLETARYTTDGVHFSAELYRPFTRIPIVDPFAVSAVVPVKSVMYHAYKFAGTYSACLIVNDGERSSDPSCVDVIVTERTSFGTGRNLIRVCAHGIAS